METREFVVLVLSHHLLPSQAICEDSSKGESPRYSLGQRSGQNRRSISASVRCISTNHSTVTSDYRSTRSQSRPTVPLDVFRTQPDVGTVARCRLMVIGHPSKELRHVMPPSTDKPSAKPVRLACVARRGGPLQARAIDVVSAVAGGVATTIDTNRFPSRVEVDISNDCTPWEVISKVKFERVSRWSSQDWT